MKQGDKAYKDGLQVCLFPLDILHCTQIPAPGEYSHCCGTATDWIGTHADYPYYAPCDCHQIERNEYTVVYRSDNQVLTPAGPRSVTFIFAHDENIPTQINFSQGDLIGHTGSAGPVTGDHLHLDQTILPYWEQQPSGIICGSGRECYETVGGLTAVNTYFITGEETVITTLGQNFKKIEDYKTPLKIWMMGAAKIRKERAKNGRQYRKIL